MDYSEEKVREHYKKLTSELIKKKISITTMESCTSGQLASLITDTEGASAIFRGAIISYSNEIKILEGVKKETIDVYSVYSEEVASEMACVCRNKMNADIGIGVTGSMGNVDPENMKASIPGNIYFAVSTKNRIESFHIELPLFETRLQYKLAVCEEIYQRLISIISML